MDMTLEQKQALQVQAEAGNFVGYIAYDPTLITPGVPETAAEDAGWTAGQSSTSPYLNEGVYTKTAPGGTFVGTSLTNVLVPGSTPPTTTGDDALVPAPTTPVASGDNARVPPPSATARTSDNAETTPGTPTEATGTNVTA